MVDFQPEHAMPLVALAVYMSSGDIIFRQRLQAATGIYTGTWDTNEAQYPRAKSGGDYCIKCQHVEDC